MTALFALLLSQAAAAPPLLVAADIGEAGMMVWWRDGDLLAGSTTTDGRPGVRPLAQGQPLALPADLSGWKPLGQRCDDTPSAQATIDGNTVTVSIVTDPTAQQIVRLTTGEVTLAENTLGRPAKICSVHIGQADALPGQEVLVTWRLGEDPASTINGLTVFRIPETARY